jgi:hypothetical protein
MPTSTLPIEQVPLGKMEHGLARAVARLGLEPAEITDRVGLRFEKGQDDLDDLEAAVFRARSGKQFALIRHRHQPHPGTDILVNERLPDLAAALHEALQALRFKPKDLTWIHPKATLAVKHQ